MAGIKHPDIEVQLTGEDGHAFFILGKVQRALRRAGVSEDEVREYMDEARSGDYNHLLATTREWVSVS